MLHSTHIAQVIYTSVIMAIRTSVSYKDALQGKAPIDPLEVRRLEGLWDDAQVQLKSWNSRDLDQMYPNIMREMFVDIPAHRFITKAEQRDPAYAEGQITVRQRKTGGYDGILNDEGQKMWHKMLTQQPSGVIINATIIPARTGTGIFQRHCSELYLEQPQGSRHPLQEHLDDWEVCRG